MRLPSCVNWWKGEWSRQRFSSPPARNARSTTSACRKSPHGRATLPGRRSNYSERKDSDEWRVRSDEQKDSDKWQVTSGEHEWQATMKGRFLVEVPSKPPARARCHGVAARLLATALEVVDDLLRRSPQGSP